MLEEKGKLWRVFSLISKPLRRAQHDEGSPPHFSSSALLIFWNNVCYLPNVSFSFLFFFYPFPTQFKSSSNTVQDGPLQQKQQEELVTHLSLHHW